jgi:hypothetical protein
MDPEWRALVSSRRARWPPGSSVSKPPSLGCRAYRHPLVRGRLAPGAGGRHAQDDCTIALNGVHRC